MKTCKNRPALATRKVLESALLIGVSLVLNEIARFNSTWIYGGSVTLGSMIPLVMLCWRWGTRQGLFSAFVFSLLQLFLGMKNVMYGRNVLQMALIALLDYVLAYTVIGLAAAPRRIIKNELVALGAGIVMVCALRFLCHFISGWLIWNALWPNDKGLSGMVYSLLYNGGYMLPETLIALVIGILLFMPLRRFWLGAD
ncbi:MAG TPA: energy-coupled thiamine transporter ThiT [Clostridia bacterium]|jgi:thiamine transporter|nr:energy-coupled thiamine transporter ThiT [Clostridia bacterium]HPY44039.1 energy-coupled thiamine transporter ThiT [Clostridia bacterium]HQA96710.1 energy-coupled thiamine transporter ThiT [Clostridia bacterium]HQO55086.1 energy-coupled thiamine transporter ThiT [Clostridia bacterium]HUM60211.1 energy-coupled thiamine transporter ThiT [Clostridia bacterium]